MRLECHTLQQSSPKERQKIQLISSCIALTAGLQYAPKQA